MVTTSDDVVRTRLIAASKAKELEEATADLEAATAAADARIAVLRTKTRKPHACHVCGTVTKEDEA